MHWMGFSLSCLSFLFPFPPPPLFPLVFNLGRWQAETGRTGENLTENHTLFDLKSREQSREATTSKRQGLTSLVV